MPWIVGFAKEDVVERLRRANHDVIEDKEGIARLADYFDEGAAGERWIAVYDEGDPINDLVVGVEDTSR
jgi:hypothetical protein